MSVIGSYKYLQPFQIPSVGMSVARAHHSEPRHPSELGLWEGPALLRGLGNHSNGHQKTSEFLSCLLTSASLPRSPWQPERALRANEPGPGGCSHGGKRRPRSGPFLTSAFAHVALPAARLSGSPPITYHAAFFVLPRHAWESGRPSLPH